MADGLYKMLFGGKPKVQQPIGAPTSEEAGPSASDDPFLNAGKTLSERLNPNSVKKFQKAFE